MLSTVCVCACVCVCVCVFARCVQVVVARRLWSHRVAWALLLAPCWAGYVVLTGTPPITRPFPNDQYLVTCEKARARVRRVCVHRRRRLWERRQRLGGDRQTDRQTDRKRERERERERGRERSPSTGVSACVESKAAAAKQHTGPLPVPTCSCPRSWQPNGLQVGPVLGVRCRVHTGTVWRGFEGGLKG